MVLWTIVVATLAQNVPLPPGTQPGTTVPSGVPLRVALERRVAIKRVGEPIHGRLVEPVYVYDRVALAGGTAVEGHIAAIGGVPARQRLKAILAGNFTPPRDVRAQFDAIVLSDGSRLAFRTSLSRGTAHTVRIAKPRNRTGERQPPRGDLAAIRAFRAPGKMSRLKSFLFGMLPYQRQSWRVGTLFNAVLQEPLNAPPPSQGKAQPDSPTIPETGVLQVSARLVAPISSASTPRGAAVEAVVTQPLFSSDHALLIPEGSRLLGEVVEAQPARRFHRNGRVFFAFRQLQLPGARGQAIQGYLEGVEADFDTHLTLDAEGATRVSSPKSRFIFPAIAVAVAGLSFHQDYNAQGVPDQDIGGRAESGAIGLGLIGTLVAQASRPLASGIAVIGAAFSVYSTFIARGADVVLPANTPVKVSLRASGGDQ